MMYIMPETFTTIDSLQHLEILRRVYSPAKNPLSTINVLKKKIIKNLSSVKNLPIFKNRNKRNLGPVLSLVLDKKPLLFKREGRTKQLIYK